MKQWKGLDELRAFLVPLEQLKEDPNNARVHPKPNLEAIKASLEEHGQLKPIVVNDEGQVIAGNGTLMAAKMLGWTHLAAVRYTATRAKQIRFAIQDNRTTDLSVWNEDELARSIQALSETDTLEGLGFSEREIKKLLENYEINFDVSPTIFQPEGEEVTTTGESTFSKPVYSSEDYTVRTQSGSFLLVYENAEEREFWCKLLGRDIPPGQQLLRVSDFKEK